MPELPPDKTVAEQLDEMSKGAALYDRVRADSTQMQDIPAQTFEAMEVGVRRIFEDTALDKHIIETSKKYKLPPGLLLFVAAKESVGNPKASSPAGAQGLMQFMPATAQDMGLEDPLDPVASVEAAGKYMRTLLKRYRGDVPTALAAYNWGMGNVVKYNKGTKPMPKETKDYVGVVTSYVEDPPAFMKELL
tara:strand:- start:2426 stop:2998 length:573 start_codon:yes stop_codon:yes gene_type:complete